MEIKKFKHVKNHKTVYAVIGAKNITEALDYVYKYKKNEYINFHINHDAMYGVIYQDKLYTSHLIDAPKDKQIDCIIVYRKTIDMINYA